VGGRNRIDATVIEEVDDRLIEWATAVAPDAGVVLSAPGAIGDQVEIALYMHSLSYELPSSTWDRPPHQLWARYLVTVAARDPRDEHRILGDLLVAALEEGDFVVESEPWAPAQWQAIGSPPRPCFGIAQLVRVPRPLDTAKPVLHELEVEGTAPVDVRGMVVGPDDVPLVDVRVELASGGRATRTDSRGRFRLAAVPPTTGERQLVLTTKGRRISVAAASDAPDPLIIRVDPPGG